MNLFSTSAGKSARQVSFEDLYMSRGINLEGIIRQAFSKTLEDKTPPHFRGRGYMADHMSWNIAGLLKENFGSLILQDEYKRLYLNLDRRVRVYFKKLNGKFAPDNVITEHVKDLNSMSLKLNDEPINVLYAGFRIRLDQFWDELKGCYLLEMKTVTKPNWVTDLSVLTSTLNNNISSVVKPLANIQLPDSIQVTGKIGQENQEKKSN